MRRDRKNRRKRQRTSIANSGSRSRRGSNKRHKSGLWDSIKSANTRAHQRSNARSWKRRGLTSVKAAISSDNITDYQLSTTNLIIRSLIGLILLFPCFISTIALFDIGNTSGLQTNYWSSLIKIPEFSFPQMSAYQKKDTSASFVQQNVINQFLKKTSINRFYINNNTYFTKREVGVIFECSKGSSTKEIAKRFSISHRTVECHLENARIKADAQNTTELVCFCINIGLIDVLWPEIEKA